MANTSINMSNLVATIESVAAGDMASHEDDPETTIITAEMIEGTTVLRLADGQSINVVQMTESLEDTINVVQVETTDELGDPYSTVDVEEICEIDIDPEEQQHILSEPGAHVVVKTSTDEQSAPGSQKPVPVVLPAVPFSFPGQTFDTKCQKLILNVWDFFRRLKKNPDLLDEIRTPQERAAAALHISAATIGKIGKNFKRTGKLETPGKKRNRAKPIVDSVNAEQEQIIRSVIKEFRDCRVTPTLPLILSECRDRINFQGGATSFRRILNRMGYKGLSAKSPNSHLKLKSVASSTLNSANSPFSSKPTQFSIGSDIFKSIKKESTYVSIPLTTSPVSLSSTKKVLSKSTTPSITVPIKSEARKSDSKAMSISNLFGGNNIVQLEGKPISISSQLLQSLASRGVADGSQSQTIHMLQPDNSMQQIQIVYATVLDK